MQPQTQFANSYPNGFLLVPDNYGYINHQTRHYNRGLRRAVYFGIGFFAIFLGISLYVIWHVWDIHNQYDQYGVNTQGTITSRNYSSGRSTTYYLHYSFSTPGGQQYFAEQEVDRTTYYNTSVGTSTPIEYLSNNPDESKIPGREADTFLYILFGIFSVLSIFFIFLLVRNIYRRNLLERTGRLIPASLGDATIRERRNRRRRYYDLSVTFQFQNPYGQTISGKDRFVRNDLWGQPLPPPGTHLLVLYANDRLYSLM